MRPDIPRCSSVSLRLHEPQLGTASTVRSWLLLEQSGPWGPDAVQDSRLPRRVSRELSRRGEAAQVRIILIRRPGRSPSRDRTVFLAHSGPRRSWLEHARLGRLEDVLEADLEGLGRGERPRFGAPDPEALFLVCTNGRRDPCCAERGRPVSRALAPELGERVWECSHIGGDRFAGNLVCLPDGVYFGRVAPEGARDIALGYRAGVLDLEHYRGRSCYGFSAQAAECLVRQRLDLRGVNDLRLTGRSRLSPDELRAEFAKADGSVLRARIGIRRESPPRPLTCKNPEVATPLVYELLELR